MIFLTYKADTTLQTENASKQLVFIKLFCLLLMISLCSISTADAQMNRLEIGDRVRVTAPFVNPMERIKGTVSEMSGSVLVLSKSDSLIYISDSLIQNLEVSTGKKRVVGRGALIGAVTGAMLFGAIWAINNDVCGPVEINCSSARSNGSAFVSGGSTGLVGGILVGAIAGFFIKIDDWERAPVRMAIGVSSIKIDEERWVAKPNVSVRIPLGD
jgi:hypothetical protein